MSEAERLWFDSYYVHGLESRHSYLYLVGNPPELADRALAFCLGIGLVLLVVVWLLGRLLRRRGEGPGLVVSRGLLLAALFLVGWETAMQLYVASNPYQVFVPDPARLWTVNPRFRQLQAKAGQHFREEPDPVLPLAGPAGEEGAFRILCLGDSQVAAVDDRKDHRLAYPSLVEEALRRAFPDRPIRVLDGAVSGYSSYQGLLLLRWVLKRWTPQVVVLAYGYQDAQPALSPDHVVATDSGWLYRVRRLAYRSQVFLALRQLLLRGQALTYRPELGRHVYARVPVERYRANYEAFLALSRKHGFRLVVLIEPHTLVEEIDAANRPYRQAAREFATRHGLPLVDGYRLFRSYHGRGFEALFTDNIHLSSRGHEVLGRELFRVLLSEVEGMGEPAEAGP